MSVKVWQPGGHKETRDERLYRLQTNAQRIALPYGAKVNMAKRRIREWADFCWDNGKNYAVSVGGLDSITLLAFCREVLGDCDGISVSILEDKSTFTTCHNRFISVTIQVISGICWCVDSGLALSG